MTDEFEKRMSENDRLRREISDNAHFANDVASNRLESGLTDGNEIASAAIWAKKYARDAGWSDEKWRVCMDVDEIMQQRISGISPAESIRGAVQQTERDYIETEQVDHELVRQIWEATDEQEAAEAAAMLRHQIRVTMGDDDGESDAPDDIAEMAARRNAPLRVDGYAETARMRAQLQIKEDKARVKVR